MVVLESIEAGERRRARIWRATPRFDGFLDEPQCEFHDPQSLTRIRASLRHLVDERTLSVTKGANDENQHCDRIPRPCSL